MLHKKWAERPPTNGGSAQRQIHAGLLVEMGVGLNALRFGIGKEAREVHA